MRNLYSKLHDRFEVFIMLFALLLIMAFCDSVLHPEEIKKVPDPKWWGAMCQVNYDNRSISTGFFVSKDGILCTAYHTIQDGWTEIANEKLWVKVFQGEKSIVYKAKILAWRDKDVDVLFLKIDYKPPFWFDEFELPKTGMDCVVMGYPLFWKLPLKAKVIENRKYYILGIDKISFPGASGSAVLNYEGKVLGMVIKRFGYLTFVNSYFIKTGLEILQNDKNPNQEDF